MDECVADAAAGAFSSKTAEKAGARASALLQRMTLFKRCRKQCLLTVGGS